MSKTTYLLYADASGDDGVYIPGSNNSSTSYFAITGIIINIEQWQEVLNRMVGFRKELRDKYGFLMRKELKGANFFHLKNSDFFQNTNCDTRKRRLAAYHFIMQSFLTVLQEVKILNLFLDKTKSSLDPKRYFDICWGNFLERYQIFLDKNNGMGIFIPDEGHEKGLINLTRKLRKYNPVKSHFGGSYSFKLKSIVEDPFHRDSRDSYFIQICDLIVHTLFRKELPSNSFKRYNGHKLFNYIEPLLLKEATRKNDLGIIKP
ncbi:MAG: DUF3800 domain-containing protein [Candidatus Marinimicrobia bacterium]|nr:DUF3800 domain-containing protein [Candidatus Neomarinimicrobiota bacterium]MCH7764013.1 DUF3800 domain-containing protein [Candidatus Neomarinimicrobiota bacterium]